MDPPPVLIKYSRPPSAITTGAGAQRGHPTLNAAPRATEPRRGPAGRSAHRLARDHHVVENEVLRPDPARAAEQLGIARVGRQVGHADFLVGELPGPRPVGIIEA